MPLLFWLDLAAIGLSLVISTSLAVMVLGAGPGRALNRSFALFTLAEAAWAVVAILLRLSLWLEMGNPTVLLEMTALFLNLMSIALLAFTVRYLRRRDRWTDGVVVLGLLLTVVLSIPLFSHQFFYNPSLGINANIDNDITPWGMAASAIAFVYLIWSLVLFWQERRRTRAPYLALSVLILTIGLFVGGVLDVGFPVLSVTNTISVALLGYGVVRRQLFNPLRELTEQLELRVEERTRELAAAAAQLETANVALRQRSTQLEAAAHVAREAAAIQDMDRLLETMVRLISDRFEFYHVGIFLLDEKKEYAELRAASSAGGQRMLARSYRLRVGGGFAEERIVGHVASRGQYRIALDIGENAVFFDNPDLPETRSEVALPLRARGEIIGVLDVQSSEPEAFDREAVTVLQVLADQMAVAIDNARLFRRVQVSLEAERRAYGELSREAWANLLRVQPDLGFIGTQQGTFPAGSLWRPEMEDALQTAQITFSDEDDARLAIPVQVGGQVIGVLEGRKPQGAGEWTAEEISMIETLTGQLNAVVERARLYRETQQRAARDRLTRDITDKMQQVADMNSLVRNTLQDLLVELAASQAVVYLGTTEELLPRLGGHGGDE